MKKRMIVKAASVMLAMLLLSGCSREVEQETKTEVTITQGDKESTEETMQAGVSEIEKDSESEAWGVSFDNIVIDNEGERTRYYINFPDYLGRDRASGQIGYQYGDVLAIVAQRYNDEFDYGDNIEDVFPTCFSQVIDILEANQVSTAYNDAFVITSQELVEINGYQMCRYEGNHTYEYDHKDWSHKYVAYATEVADGAYVFWMLIDESEDNSSLDLAREYALKMAHTLRLEE